ncbi:MAG: DUF3089 domain-containing protein [Pseudomonadota bacterium]
MARKFLIGLAVIIGLIIVGGVVLNRYAAPLLAWYFVPSEPFDAAAVPPEPNYQDWSSWAVGNPSAQTTADLRPSGADPIEPYDIAIFYVHPTSYWDNDAWVAAIDNENAADRLEHLFIKGQASAFDPYGTLYAPRYRQAAFGAFLANDENTFKALTVAGGDVRNAFENFLMRIGPDTPFIIVGHSQGSFHGLTLLHTSMATPERQNRLIAAYLIGWTIAPDADLPAWTSPCDTPDQLGCVLSWQTFGPDGDASPIRALFEAAPSLTGASKKGESMLCVNPLSFTRSTQTYSEDQNLGGVAITAVDKPLEAAVPKVVGARCDEDGILYTTNQPEGRFNTYVMPGNNLHAQDIQLFYRNLQANVAQRIEAYLAKQDLESR